MTKRYSWIVLPLVISVCSLPAMAVTELSPDGSQVTNLEVNGVLYDIQFRDSLRSDYPFAPDHRELAGSVADALAEFLNDASISPPAIAGCSDPDRCRIELPFALNIMYGTSVVRGDVETYPVWQTFEYGGLGTSPNWGELSYSTGATFPTVVLDRGGASGSWYNRDRDGEGFFVEIAEGGDQPQFAVSWYTYDDNRNQMWLYGNAPIPDGATSITVPVLMPSGALFGDEFNASDVDFAPWGSLTFQFPNCDNGVVGYSSSIGFGSGTIDLVRLTHLVQTACTEGPLQLDTVCGDACGYDLPLYYRCVSFMETCLPAEELDDEQCAAAGELICQSY